MFLKNSVTFLLHRNELISKLSVEAQSFGLEPSARKLMHRRILGMSRFYNKMEKFGHICTSTFT